MTSDDTVRRNERALDDLLASSVMRGRAMAHLRRVPVCVDCNGPARFALYNGVNALLGHYCQRHAEPALKRYKETGRVGGSEV